MGRIYRFLKSTILGGLVIVVPVVVIGAVVVWAVGFTLEILALALDWLPHKSVGGVSMTVLAAVAGLVIVCFLAGIFAQTAILRRIAEHAERLALFVPGYALMKNVGANLIGVETQLKTVLVAFPGSWQLGFLMEVLPDGRYVVFIPGVPKALIGTLHVVAADRVQLLTMSVSRALDDLSRLGVGLRETWAREPISA